MVAPAMEHDEASHTHQHAASTASTRTWKFAKEHWEDWSVSPKLSWAPIGARSSPSAPRKTRGDMPRRQASFRVHRSHPRELNASCTTGTTALVRTRASVVRCSGFLQIAPNLAKVPKRPGVNRRETTHSLSRGLRLRS